MSCLSATDDQLRPPPLSEDFRFPVVGDCVTTCNSLWPIRRQVLGQRLGT